LCYVTLVGSNSAVSPAAGPLAARGRCQRDRARRRRASRLVVEL